MREEQRAGDSQPRPEAALQPARALAQAAGAVLSAALLLAPIAAAPLAAPLPCTGRVEALAKDISDKPGLVDLRRKIATAAVLCSDGKNDEANKLLSEVERALKTRSADPAQQGMEIPLEAYPALTA
jgi:hypothetical protein